MCIMMLGYPRERCEIMRTMAMLNLVECVVACVGKLPTFREFRKHGKAAAKRLGAI